MKNEVIHWIDLDYTLWETNAMWWIIDKNNPSKYLVRVSQHEAYLIMSGHYAGANHKIYYNGIDGWLSNELWNKIQQIKSIDAENLGISWREYINVDLIEKQTENLIIHIDRIKHLAGTKDVINLLTARGNKKGHELLIKTLREHLEKHNIHIKDEYFVSDPTVVNMAVSSSEKKMLCILQNIVGYKIKDNHFEPIVMDKYDISNFYDDEDRNIEECLNINTWLKKYLENTIPWLKQKIEESISMRKPKLILNVVTSNELNPFMVQEVKIKII